MYHIPSILRLLLVTAIVLLYNKIFGLHDSPMRLQCAKDFLKLSLHNYREARRTNDSRFRRKHALIANTFLTSALQLQGPTELSRAVHFDISRYKRKLEDMSFKSS